MEGARPLRFAALCNAAACVAAFAVASDVGEGVTRLQYVALPVALLALALRHWRPRRLVLLVALVATCWNGAPLVRSFAVGVAGPTVNAAYWWPAIGFLRTHLAPSYRVKVVDTTHHWAAAYLPAAGIPLARGWFRQHDFPENRALYEPLTASGYLRWLHGLGVAYVVLTDAAPDYSAEREAALLRSGRSGLRLIQRTAHLRIFTVPAPRAIVSGPRDPRLTALGRDRLSVSVAAAGDYRIAVRYSPYWRPSRGCLRPGSDDMLRLRAPGPGVVRIAFRVSVAAMLSALAPDADSAC